MNLLTVTVPPGIQGSSASIVAVLIVVTAVLPVLGATLITALRVYKQVKDVWDTINKHDAIMSDIVDGNKELIDRIAKIEGKHEQQSIDSVIQAVKENG